jgi:hypothetical protein
MTKLLEQAIRHLRQLPDDMQDTAARAAVLCRVEVFPLEVEQQLPSWPEEGQRLIQWFEPQAACEAVQEPELSALIRNLAALLG